MEEVWSCDLHARAWISHMHATEIVETGDPEVLRYVDKPPPSPRKVSY
ncbi:hypothetical protein [Mycobacterium leprae]|nr:hypothetical protein [Mycobacterium leprae]